WWPSPPVTTPVPRVTLRRASSGKSRKEKSSNRLSMGSREAAEGPGRPSGSPFLPFSWFSDSARGCGSPGSASPAGSPRHERLSPPKSASQVRARRWARAWGVTRGELGGSDRGGRCGRVRGTLKGGMHGAGMSGKVLGTPKGGSMGQRGVGGFGVPQWGFHGVGKSEMARGTLKGEIHGVGKSGMARAPGCVGGQPAVPQALGVGSSQDRAVLKRRLKELSLAAERERKAREKAEKQREKHKRKDQEQR
ncbi:SAM14 protein, partial [Thryothorus ludovicianus]|nr:SAM14 protein [Thryothorus ludovicianus]